MKWVIGVLIGLLVLLGWRMVPWVQSHISDSQQQEMVYWAAGDKVETTQSPFKKLEKSEKQQIKAEYKGKPIKQTVWMDDLGLEWFVMPDGTVSPGVVGRHGIRFLGIISASPEGYVCWVTIDDATPEDVDKVKAETAKGKAFTLLERDAETLETRISTICAEKGYEGEASKGDIR